MQKQLDQFVLIVQSLSLEVNFASTTQPDTQTRIHGRVGQPALRAVY